MHEANTALLDIFVDKSVIVGFGKDGLLAEFEATMSRSCRFCCFFASYIACILNSGPISKLSY